jgi:hypothetical protein
MVLHQPSFGLEREPWHLHGRTPMIDETHDPGRTSWVPSANGHKTFPIQNLPHGVFSPEGGAARGGIAIGEKIFDISTALEVGLFAGLALEAAQAASGRSLNAWLESSPVARRALRRRVGELLDSNGGEATSLQAIANGCCMTARAAPCICPRGSATSRISSPAFITPVPPARSADRNIR